MGTMAHTPEIKNRTSIVPVTQSVNHIEKRLVAAGAARIFKMYSQKKLTGVAFSIREGDLDVAFKLPARIDKVEIALREAGCRPKRGNMQEQAERTAWKILSDWVDIQMTLVFLKQATAIEIFLAYAYDQRADQTLFEKIEQGGYKELPLLPSTSNQGGA